jgi:hypothetical protein
MKESSGETSPGPTLQSGLIHATQHQFLQKSKACKQVAAASPLKLSSSEFCAQLKKVQITTLFDDSLGWLDGDFLHGLQVCTQTQMSSLCCSSLYVPPFSAVMTGSACCLSILVQSLFYNRYFSMLSSSSSYYNFCSYQPLNHIITCPILNVLLSQVLQIHCIIDEGEYVLASVTDHVKTLGESRAARMTIPA